MLITLVSFSFLAHYAISLEYDSATCRKTSLLNTPWPSDHGDSSRSKYTINAGFPTDLSEEILKVEELGVEGAQWLYTGGQNNEYIFVHGGEMSSPYVAKLDAVSLKIIQKITLKSSMYLGGLLVHANGHLYCVQGNRLYAYWNADLYNVSFIDLPTTLNKNLVHTNGMVVTHDGLLVIKQWNLIVEDLAFFIALVPKLVKFSVAIVVGSFSIYFGKYFIQKKSFSFGSLFSNLVYSILTPLIFLVLSFLILIYKLSGPFDIFLYLFSNTILNNRGGYGELKLVHPETLETVADLKLSERCSFARMALSTVIPNKEDAIVFLGDEFSHQVRWNSEDRTLYEVQEWSMRYRSRWTGTFPGTGPAIVDNAAYFTDNTYPVLLFGQSYTLFKQPLGGPYQQPQPQANEKKVTTYPKSFVVKENDNHLVHAAEGHENQNVPLAIQLTPSGPGFMFWSTVVSPVVGDVIVWDIVGKSVQARRMSDLSLHWEVKAWNSDCLTVAADRGHVYMADFSSAPTTVSGWGFAVGQESSTRNTDSVKYLVVADTNTGKVLLNTTLSTRGGIRPALIMPGAHNDVLIGGTSGLVRLYFNQSKSSKD
jgi:hypothetical protein